MAVIDYMEATNKVRVYDRGIDPPDADAGAHAGRSGDIAVPRTPSDESLRLECEELLAPSGSTVRRTDGEDGLEVTRLLEAAGQSLRAGGERSGLETP